MKTLFVWYLNILARLTLRRFKPRIVGITGSVGKTSTKEAIFCVLKNHVQTRANKSSYNNEFGLPLTILGLDTPGRNPFGWIMVFIKAILVLLGSDFPKVLVLEMGADRTGDIKKLLSVVGRLDVAILTDIGVSHLENYSNLQALVNEKLSIFFGLKNDGLAILNGDNEKIRASLSLIKQPKLTYGFDESSDAQAVEFQFLDKDGSSGTNFKIRHKGTVVPFYLPESFGKPNVYAALAAAAAGLFFGLNLVNASEALMNYRGPAGRLKLLYGIKRTWIIDDTYNAAPASTLAALEVLNQISKGRKVVAIGDMAELGPESEALHRQIGVRIQEMGVSLVFAIGSKAKAIEDELLKRKFSGRVLWFEDSDKARMTVQNLLVEGDTILIKGSQSVRMEKIVKEIMTDPMSADRLLVRQSEAWLKR
jgi:UDP-N-acetylmuramoyl-tripeptide--D-alanyl-D-alanine ligase